MVPQTSGQGEPAAQQTETASGRDKLTSGHADFSPLQCGSASLFANDMSERASISVPSIKLSSPETHEFWEIPVVFEDEHLLAISKPARLLTSPDRYDPNRPNLMRLLHSGITENKPWARERRLS